MFDNLEPTSLKAIRRDHPLHASGRKSLGHLPKLMSGP
jgi:hypothetical protein